MSMAAVASSSSHLNEDGILEEALKTITFSKEELDYFERRRRDSVNGIESPLFLSPSTSFSAREVISSERDFFCDSAPVPPNNPLFTKENIVTYKSGQLYSVVSIETSEVTEEKKGKRDSSRVIYIYGIVPYMPGQRQRVTKRVAYWAYEEHLAFPLWTEPSARSTRPPLKKRKTSVPVSHPLGCECKECDIVEEECANSENEH